MTVSAFIGYFEIAGIPEVLLSAAVLLLFCFHKKDRFRPVLCSAVFCAAFVCFFTAAVPVNAESVIEVKFSVDPEDSGKICLDVGEGDCSYVDKYDISTDAHTDVKFALTAVANEGYIFTEWLTKGLGGTCSGDTNPCTFGLKDLSYAAVYDITATAKFEKGYLISASADPKAGGEVNGGGPYPDGETVTLTAEPKSGYSFVNWTENGKTVST